MFNVCPQCGIYSEEKEIDLSGPYAICPHCQYKHPFKQLPLFILTGASGTGKTTVGLQLVSVLPECVVLREAMETPPITILDTTDRSLEEIIEAAVTWTRERLP